MATPSTVVDTWKVDTTKPVFSGLPASTASYGSSADVPAPPAVTAADNCDGAVSVSYQEIQTNPGNPCNNTITRTWTASDSCGNTATYTQTITVGDTIVPLLTCPPDCVRVKSDDNCPDHPDPNTTGTATATDNSGLHPTMTYSDQISGVCPKVISRTWKATDACGNYASAIQTITCYCQPSLITDTMRCTLPNNQLRLIFTQDAQNMPCYKLTASNPGQFYYNIFYSGGASTVGQQVTFNVTVPYPWVTQGANPVEVYDGVTVTTGGGQTCLVPGTKILAGPQQVTLASYNPAAMGSTTTLTVTVRVPASGFVFLAVHLDYGLKGTSGFSQNTAADATACGNTARVLIPNNGLYTFSVGGGATDSASVASYNTFKKNPGIGGLVQSLRTTAPVPGANVALKDAKGALLLTGVTDQDGWYVLNYKATGKTGTLYVTLTPPAGFGAAQTKSVTLKSNGYAEVDFITP
ncbi:MAG: hypothetical protein DME25_15285 [Verrucomicrobia bacterium]|nr:MAG: hypothetical protein DME25_15285 [Verrucomicrobiota bacterium]